MTALAHNVITPRRGEIWLTNFDPVVGREQGGQRPALILSADGFNLGGSGLIFAIPLSSTIRAIRTHVVITSPEGGVRVPSDIMTEQTKAISVLRLVERWGSVTPATLTEVEKRIRWLLTL